MRSLAIYLKFARVCASTEEYITKYCGQISTNRQDLVDLNHVRMYKQNENEREILRKMNSPGIIGSLYPPTENNEVESKNRIIGAASFLHLFSELQHCGANGLQILCEIIVDLFKICESLCVNRGIYN
ncbi:hypothetical protein NQ317_011353 [Molorchus minor]|uniref:Uncharacterized protein n=1 Tax=Molorchus minor TaxID=1323400 RepID=A0ABQ9IX23_9CUCU|nr:hypothetical protein NQ317_011353 [Molorchus minor]